MLPSETQLVARLTGLGQTIAVAESLTAGMVAATIASVPGASVVLRGGAVTYATDTKTSLLGVDEELLARGGAVQSQVAEQMASGVRTVFGADHGLATTGVAGPDPQDGVEVGVVFIAIATPDGVMSDRLDLDGDRERIRRSATTAALRLALAHLGHGDVE